MTKRFFLLALLVSLGWSTSRGQELNPAPSFAQYSSSNAFDTHLNLSPPPPKIWANGVGEGFRRGAREVEFTVGYGLGIRDGSTVKHDLAISEIRFGQVLTDVLGEGHWYQGNLELMGELFVGAQYHPGVRYFVGVAPVLRYNFITGTRWVPFMDGSIGVTATAIGRPDLGSVFEFNLQGGPGVQYFFRPDAAIILQDRYLHFSSAGIFHPNKGINVNNFLIGMSWYF